MQHVVDTPKIVTNKKSYTVAEFLFDYIHRQGVEHAFAIPGDFVLPSFKWLVKSGLNIITMTHEPAVGFAADCYARSKGLGLAVVTYCVGGLNMLNSIACAYAEKSPVIVVSGGPSYKNRHKDPMWHHKVRSMDTQRHIYEEVTVANTVLLDPETAAAEIIRVVEAAKTNKRPVYIEIPFDIVDVTIKLPDSFLQNNMAKPVKIESDQEILQAAVDEIVSKLNQAKNPVIIAGEELHRFNLTDLVADFAKKYNIPIAATLLGKSVVRETNPLYLGIYSGIFSEEICKKYVDASDFVLVIGAIISDVFLGFMSDHFDRKRSAVLNMEHIQLGMHVYQEVFLPDILNKLLAVSAVKVREDFINPNKFEFYKAELAKFSQNINKNEQVTVNALFSLLSANLPESSTIVADTGDALMGAIGIRTDKRSHFFADAYYLSMGFAVPAAIGAIYANPTSKTYAIVGDGAFQMTGTELSTIAKYKLSLVVIIINNDGYGTQRHILDGEFNNIQMWDYTKICELIGYGKAVKVRTINDLQNALQEAASYNGLYLIEVVVNKDDASDTLKRMGKALKNAREG